MASENGMFTAVCTRTFAIEHQTIKPEFAWEDLVDMVAIYDQAGLFALAYASGLVSFVLFYLTFSIEDSAVFDTFGQGVLDRCIAQQEQIKFSNMTVSSFQLCSIEVCRQEDAGLVKVWCGCDWGVIKIYTPPNKDTEAQFKTEINTCQCSADISQDSNIVQLKSNCFSVSEAHMLALHDRGGVISCCSVSNQPTLTTVIKPSHLTSTGSCTTIVQLSSSQSREFRENPHCFSFKRYVPLSSYSSAMHA